MEPQQSAADFWEHRYSERDSIWSGNPNAALVTEASSLPAGRALDLGCGEGADSIWLAERGWQVTGLDISTTALERARREAESRGVAEATTWLQQDLSTWEPTELYDLVSAHFLHSPVELPRERILQSAASAVAPGGTLLIVGHAEVPAGITSSHPHVVSFPTAPETVDQLGLVEPEWAVTVCENRPRTWTSPDGETRDILDTIVVARRATPS
ncbi:SAM-dependent methyltransferase [Leifsonia sp. A12D58]|uniref:SAM-dependent methyltransferase n=1 Tax=Leifsonia sp. A12D58 TaxID=3397674 RepID=UPI0039E18BEB